MNTIIQNIVNIYIDELDVETFDVLRYILY